MKEKLPPTDSRLRPDQRHLENGEFDKANVEKLRLETRQRMVYELLFLSMLLLVVRFTRAGIWEVHLTAVD